MVGGDIFGAGGHAEIAHDALHKQLASLLESALAGQGHALFHLDILGAGLVAAVTGATIYRLWEYAMKLGLHLPGVGDLLQVVGVVGGGGKDQEVYFHSLFEQGLTPQGHGYFGALGPAHQDAA